MLREQFLALKHRRPDTGEDLGERVWCGRCGGTEFNEPLVRINHELGWTAGCYAYFRPGTVRPLGHLTEARRADRWDRQFFADCATCGHPWGLHSWHLGGGSFEQQGGCHALLRPQCDCPAYLAASR